MDGFNGDDVKELKLDRVVERRFEEGVDGRELRGELRGELSIPILLFESPVGTEG